MQLACPCCHARFPLDAAVQDEAARELMALLAQAEPATRPLISYLTFFRSKSRALAWDRVLKLAREVLELTSDRATLAAALAEIARVLKPGGFTMHLFPDRGYWREGHNGIPFAHWFPRGSTLRDRYAAALRALGMGKVKDAFGGAPCAWAAGMMRWMDDYCFYRPRHEILASFQRAFGEVALREDDYIAYRLRGSPLKPLAVSPVGRELYRRLGGLVVCANKLNPE